MQVGSGNVRISEYVRGWVPAIIQLLEREDPEELDRLLDPAYSRRTFGLMGGRAFFKLSQQIQRGSEDDRRYGKRDDFVYKVRGREVRLNSQWFDRQRPSFERYLKRIGLTPDERRAAMAVASTGQSPPVKEPTPTRPVLTTSARSAEARDREFLHDTDSTTLQAVIQVQPSPRASARNHIGNAQNLWVRNVLDRVQPDQQPYGGWHATVTYFSSECVYCGSRDGLEKDHIYGINARELGQHREGNLVPACRQCNSKKSSLDFRDFLARKYRDDPSEARRRVERLEGFMASRGYVPIPRLAVVDRGQITDLLQRGREEIAALAERYVQEIRTLLKSMD